MLSPSKTLLAPHKPLVYIPPQKSKGRCHKLPIWDQVRGRCLNAVCRLLYRCQQNCSLSVLSHGTLVNKASQHLQLPGLRVIRLPPGNASVFPKSGVKVLTEKHNYQGQSIINIQSEIRRSLRTSVSPTQEFTPSVALFPLTLRPFHTRYLFFHANNSYEKNNFCKLLILQSISPQNAIKQPFIFQARPIFSRLLTASVSNFNINSSAD